MPNFFIYIKNSVGAKQKKGRGEPKKCRGEAKNVWANPKNKKNLSHTKIII